MFNKLLVLVMAFYDEQCHATAQYKCILTTEYNL